MPAATLARRLAPPAATGIAARRETHSRILPRAVRSGSQRCIAPTHARIHIISVMYVSGRKPARDKGIAVEATHRSQCRRRSQLDHRVTGLLMLPTHRPSPLSGSHTKGKKTTGCYRRALQKVGYCSPRHCAPQGPAACQTRTHSCTTCTRNPTHWAVATVGCFGGLACLPFTVTGDLPVS